MNINRNTMAWTFARIVLGFIFLGPPSLIMSQERETHIFDREECIDYGLKHNKELQNKQFDEYLAQKDVNELLSAGFPQVKGEANGQYNFALPVFVLPGPSGELQKVSFGLPWQASAGASISQLVADGVYFVGLEASRSFVRLSEKVTLQNKEEIAYAISTAYYTALTSNEQLKLLKANIERLQKLYEETKALNENGFVEKIDVERLEINLNNLEVESQKAERFNALSIELLKFQMGMPIEDKLILKSAEEFEVAEEVALQPTFSFENKIEYKILENRKRLEQYNLKRHNVSYFPSLYAFGNYSINRQWEPGTDNNFKFNVGAVGLQLNVPIFDGTRKRNLVQKSKISLRKIDNEIALFEMANKLERKQADIKFQNAKNSLKTYERTKDLAEKVYEVSRIKYKEGVGSSIEVNQAENALKEAEINYIRGQYDYLLAVLEVKKAKGEFSKYH